MLFRSYTPNNTHSVCQPAESPSALLSPCSACPLRHPCQVGGRSRERGGGETQKEEGRDTERERDSKREEWTESDGEGEVVGEGVGHRVRERKRERESICEKLTCSEQIDREKVQTDRNEREIGETDRRERKREPCNKLRENSWECSGTAGVWVLII